MHYVTGHFSAVWYKGNSFYRVLYMHIIYERERDSERERERERASYICHLVHFFLILRCKSGFWNSRFLPFCNAFSINEFPLITVVWSFHQCADVKLRTHS